MHTSHTHIRTSHTRPLRRYLQALPQGTMTFDAGSTASDLGNFYTTSSTMQHDAAEAPAPRSLSSTLPFPTAEGAAPRGRRRGSMPGTDPAATMNFTLGTTQGDLGAHIAGTSSGSLASTLSTTAEAAPRMRRRGSMPGVDPSSTMDFSAGTTLSDLGAH